MLLDLVFQAVAISFVIAIPVFYVLWILLLIRKYDFSKSKTKSWLFIVTYALLSAAALLFFAFQWAFICYKTCPPDHTEQELRVLAQASAVILLYVVPAKKTLDSKNNKGAKPLA